MNSLIFLSLKEVMLMWPVLARPSRRSDNNKAVTKAPTNQQSTQKAISFTEYKREGYYKSIMNTDVKLSVLDAFIIRNNDKTGIKVEIIMIFSSVFGAVRWC